MVDYSDSWTPAGNFGIVTDTDTTGGFRVVADAAERLAIPAPRRKKGMRVVQADTNIIYVLTTNNLDELTESDFEQESLSQIITIDGDASGFGSSTISLSEVTASHIAIGTDGSSLTNLTASQITNFTEDVRAQFSAGTNVTIVDGVISSTAGGTGDVTQAGNNTFTGVNTFNVNYITGSITGSDAKFTSLTGSVQIPDKTVTINAISPIVVSNLSLSLTSIASGFFKSNVQIGPSTYTQGLGIASNGKVFGFTYDNVALPLGTQKAGGLSINTGDAYNGLQIGKPTTLAYSLAGSAINFWSEGGLLGASGVRNTAVSTGQTSDAEAGPNYYYMYSIGATRIFSGQYPTFSLARARNNFASPSVVQTGDILGTVRFEGRTVSGTATQANVDSYRTACFIAGIAEQTFSSGSYGGGIGFWTVPNGTNIRPISQPPSMWINNLGNVGIGLGAQSTTPYTPTQATYKLQVNGTISGSNIIGDGSQITNLSSSQFPNFADDVRAQFSAGTNVTIVDGVISSAAGGTGDVTEAGNNTFTGINTFNSNYITGSITGSDAKFVSITGSLSGTATSLANMNISQFTNDSNFITSDVTLSTITATTYEISSTDKGKTLLLNNSNAQTVTCPTGLDVGFNCTIVQLGAGQATITGAGGVTLLNRQSQFSTAGQYAAVSMVVISTNNILIAGDTQ